MKIDDDIVFLDLNRFDDFIRYIKSNPDKNFIIPNIINHGVSMFYNLKNGLIPGDFLTKYKNKKNPNETYFCFKDGRSAIKIHNYFLDNIQKFVNNLNEPISLDGYKTSICFFGVSKKNFAKFLPSIIVAETSVYNTFHFDDERYIYGLKGNYWYPRFIVSHYGFGPQRKKRSFKRFKKKIIIRYKELNN